MSYIFKNENKYFGNIERDTKPRIISNKEIIERAISRMLSQSRGSPVKAEVYSLIPLRSEKEREHRVSCNSRNRALYPHHT